MPQSPVSAPKGVGIDVVSFSRVREFYEKHSDQLRKILSGPELEKIKSDPNPPEALAFSFSAKEAVFKSLDLDWLGVEGFRMIQVYSTPDRRKARAEVSGLLARKLNGRLKRWEIDFEAVERQFVIARCIAF